MIYVSITEEGNTRVLSKEYILAIMEQALGVKPKHHEFKAFTRGMIMCQTMPEALKEAYRLREEYMDSILPPSK